MTCQTTLTVRTASGGEHRYFTTGTPIGNSASRIAEDIDVRGEGGYVVGPGSVIDGREYTIAENGPQAALPEFLIRLAATAPRATSLDIRRIVAVDTPDAIARAEEWLRTAPEAVEGAGGDDLTFRTACRVFDFGLSPDAAWDAMLDHWNDRCSPPWDPEDLRAKVDNAARYRSSPIGIASPEAEFGVVLDADEIEAKASWRTPARRQETHLSCRA